MVDETDVSEEMKWFYEGCASKVLASLKRNSINAQYVANRQEALTTVLGLISDGASVSRADSVTLDQIGIIPELKKCGRYKIIHPLERREDGSLIFESDERQRMYREIFSCDVFLTGTNAVTLDGKLVNVDGSGNRVAPMIFGPNKVIIVAGVNKIVRDVDEALARIREFAAPVNAKRHILKHNMPGYADAPCVRTGKCVDCKSDYRSCNYTVVIEGAMLTAKGRINVVLVGEELGI
ncbi:lactate utilization protein [Chloroflexota bacterium]